MAQHRPVSAAHRLLSLDIVLALSALAGGLRVLYLAAPEPSLPSEAATVAHAYALGHLTSFADASGAGVSPFGWWQLAAVTTVSDAFGRSATALAAVRETVLFAALAGAVLLWTLARRLGLTRWASAAAVLVVAASPLALGLQRLVVVEHLAAAWALGALVLITRPDARIRHDIVAAGCLLAAVLTSPLALLFLPAAAWLLVRRAPARAALVVVLLNLGLGVAFGPAAATLRPHLAAATGPSAAAWAALDPVWVALSAVALVAALAVRALRPLAVTGLMLAATLLVPGVSATAVLALLVPVTPLLPAGVAQAMIRRRRAPARHGSPGRLARLSVADAATVQPISAHRGDTARRSCAALAHVTWRLTPGHRGSRCAQSGLAGFAPRPAHRGDVSRGSRTEASPNEPATPRPGPTHHRDTTRRSRTETTPADPTTAHHQDASGAGRAGSAPAAGNFQPRTAQHGNPSHRGWAEVSPADPTTPRPSPARDRDTSHRSRIEAPPTDPGHTTTSHPTPAHHSRAPRRRIAVASAAAVLAAAVAASWGVGYPALRPAFDRGGPLASARDWLQANASGSRLLVDDAAWAELAGSGWPTGMLAPPAACARTCPPAEWAVFGGDETGLRQRYPALEGAFAGAGPTAVFGGGDTRVTVWRLGLPLPDPAAPPEAPARAHAGEALTESARIALTSEAAAVLREGCADPRLIATIAALAAIQPVGVAAFPEVPGEDAAGQPRRRVLLTGGEAGTTAFYTGQRDLFRPASVVRTADGVLVTYPLFAPAGLLVPYSSP